MAIRRIFSDSEDILFKKSRPVTVFDKKLWTLLDDMRDTMRKADGVGLAAPQVGLLRRIAVVEVEDLYLELINPKIIGSTGSQLAVEACLSVDSSKNCKVMRPQTVVVEAYDRNGKKYQTEVNGLSARACCHEIDHLDGVVFYMREYKG